MVLHWFGSNLKPADDERARVEFEVAPSRSPRREGSA